MNRAILDDLLAARAAGRPVALATDLGSGAQLLVYGEGTGGELAVAADLVAAMREALKRDNCTTLPSPSGPVFVQPFNPPPRLILVGAVHIAQPLARLGEIAGYGVALIDPRRAFGAAERFVGFEVTSEWPDEALARLRPDARTAVVTLTHDPKLDDPALAAALNSPAFYIGALGSRKTHAQRLARLQARGLPAAELNRIHGPVGLAIGALSPAEIAVSIMAEITQVRRRAVAP
ncbi:MAG: XdhC family protein [Pseudomonadota bacterium]